MAIDSFDLHGKKRVPKNAHTVFSFNLPFVIPIPDGGYRIRLGKYVADITIKRVQRKTVGGFRGSGVMQLNFDKYGKSSFSSIKMKLPWSVDLYEHGRTPSFSS